MLDFCGGGLFREVLLPKTEPKGTLDLPAPSGQHTLLVSDQFIMLFLTASDFGGDPPLCLPSNKEQNVVQMQTGAVVSVSFIMKEEL